MKGKTAVLIAAAAFSFAASAKPWLKGTTDKCPLDY